MHIVLRTSGMPFNGSTLETASLGGSETAALYLARELAKQGHEVVHFTNSRDEGTFDGVRYVWAGEMSEQHPLGDRFHYYAMNTPHDVHISQRSPASFRYPWLSKLNYLWLHDLALHRQRSAMLGQMWNVTRVLVVSEYHKQQVCDVYGLDANKVAVLPNGVDASLFSELATEHLFELPGSKKHLIYSSRPERGLEHLVKPGGIMEQLGEGYHLHVCGYDNTAPQMRSYYEALWARCDALPNVSNHGPLTKGDLAALQNACDAWVYPTEFEEVFCITAVEVAMAGTKIVASDCAVLPETCGKGVRLVAMKNGEVNEAAFVKTVRNLDKIKQDHTHLLGYTVEAAGECINNLIHEDFAKGTASVSALARHFLHMSDISALLELRKRTTLPKDVEAELQECYGFYLNDTFAEHYQRYYDYEKARGVNYGPENLDGNQRFEYVASCVGALPAGSTVLDYGCAHGHYTINLARRYPDIRFIGVDITETNITKAEAWAEAEQLTNVTFVHGCYDEGNLPAKAERTYSLIIAAEVAEHVADPAGLVYGLSRYLVEEGQMVVTTPFGPWEAIGYKEHWPWRAHIHHLERADLQDLFGQCPGFKIMVVPSGNGLGSYVTEFTKPATIPAHGIDWDRKLHEQSPRQTLSVCMIVKDGAASIRRTIDSVKDIADEIVVMVDETTSDDTHNIILDYAQRLNIVSGNIESPLKTGFDEARNASVARATSDWIMWLDADEVLHHPERVLKYLRPSMYDGYAMKQHHMAVEPVGCIKTDLPCRLFRNGRGVRFFGVVHEHPEVAINQGLGHITVMGDVDIMHDGYATEAIRRRRFERNIGLMARDRDKYPERHLGKFLWVRDLSLMCQYTAERNGGRLTREMVSWAEEGIALWEELVKAGNLRLALDGLEFYSTLVKVMGGGFEMAFKVDTSKFNGGAHLEHGREIHAEFASRAHADLIVKAMIDEKTAAYDSQYF